MIEKLNAAGLQEIQISIDGVQRNETTEKVLDNLKKRLLALREHARFAVTVSGVIGAAPPGRSRGSRGLRSRTRDSRRGCFWCTIGRASSN